jgi:hypothetical protein
VIEIDQLHLQLQVAVTQDEALAAVGDFMKSPTAHR